MERSQGDEQGQTHLPEAPPATAQREPERHDHLAEQVRAWEASHVLADAPGLDVAGDASPALASELAEELDAVRQRLAYYERFDSLINDSIQRSADLFQALFAEREAQRREGSSVVLEATAAAHAEAARELASERREMHETLLGLMTEASRLQRQVDGLIQQIAEAVTDLSGRDTSPIDAPIHGA